MSELKRLGYADAYRDAAGNVISAPIAKDARITAFVAHLDTVVQPGVTSHRHGRQECKRTPHLDGTWRR